MSDSKTSNFKMGAKSQPKQDKPIEKILKQPDRVQKALEAYNKSVSDGINNSKEQLLTSLRLAASYITEGYEEKVLKVICYSLMQVLESNGYVRSEDHDAQFNLINRMVSDIIQNLG